MIPLILAPLLTKLAESGLNLIGNAVLNKGKDFVEDKLGVNLEDALGTEEGKLKLLQLQVDKEETLLEFALENRKIDLDYYRLDAEDRANARNMNADIQTSKESSWTAKNFAYILDGIIVGGTLALATLLFFKTIPDDNLQIANIALGTLLTLCGTVVNFHRGTSAGSTNKDSTINTLSKGAVK